MDVALASAIADRFPALYYNNGEQTWGNTYWLGHQVLKCPLDLWNYQEILYDLRPALIVETGTYLGGSQPFLARRAVAADRDHGKGARLKTA